MTPDDFEVPPRPTTDAELAELPVLDLDEFDTALTWGWDGRLDFTEDVTRQAAIIGYQETSELRA